MKEKRKQAIYILICLMCFCLGVIFGFNIPILPLWLNPILQILICGIVIFSLVWGHMDD